MDVRAGAILSCLLVGACASAPEPMPPPPPPAAALTPPARLCVTASPRQPCRPADRVEGWLADPALEILGVDDPPAGNQAARVLTLAVPDGDGRVVFRAKWRAHHTYSSNNDPRYELAAYAVQKLYLEPREYVVPPTAPHCFELPHYRAAVDPDAAPSFDGVDCVYGVLSYWLEEVQSLREADRAGWFDWEDGLYDDALFERNPIYRDAMANLNVLTHLIEHGDTHWKQFLIATDAERPFVYSVDNSMAFGIDHNTGLGEHDFSALVVPAIPARTADRLRAALPALERELAVIAWLEDRAGRLVATPPPRSVPGAGDAGLQWIDGHLAVRLTAAEIAALRARIERLLARIDVGELATY